MTDIDAPVSGMGKAGGPAAGSAKTVHALRRDDAAAPDAARMKAAAHDHDDDDHDEHDHPALD